MPQQHGFCTGRSIITCSISFTYFIYDNLRKGAQVNVILTNFSKAFDTVPHTVTNLIVLALVTLFCLCSIHT